MPTLRLNFIVLILLLLFFFLQYRLWFEAGGIRDSWRLKKALALQEQENDKYKKQNDELVFQVERLQKSDEATESRARNELGMIKKDEIFYQIVK